MPEIPVAGFVLESLGAALLALLLTSLGRRRPRAGLRDWALGLWALSAALVASIAMTRAREPVMRVPAQVVATVLAYLAGAAALLRTNTEGRSFGPRVLGLAFLGNATEEALFFSLVAAGSARLALRSDLLVEAELVLLMLTGVGMIAWLLEDERAASLALQEALHRREALSEMGALVAGAAHEARNPLFAISASLDALAARTSADASTAKLVAVMREPVARLGALMSDLLEYGRPIDAAKERRSLVGVASKAIEVCRPEARRRDVSIKLTGEPAEGVVPMDEPRVVQVLQNVVQNAVEHSPRGGVVTVSVSAESRGGRRGVRCDVRDEGAGFAAADLPRVFEPFYSRRSGGTGLGLSIVRRIVVQHGGEVTAANGPGGGGVVTLWLAAGD